MKKLSILFIIALIISHSKCGYSLEYKDILEDDCSYFEDYKKFYCEILDAGDVNKKCSFVDNKCISTYKKCEDYNENVQKNICESITFSDEPEKKCVFKDNNCVEEQRKCSDFKLGLEPISNCPKLISSDDKKICIFKNNKCEEQYRNCEDYKDNVQQKICESIQPFGSYEVDNGFDYGLDYYYLDYKYKCVFNNGKCVKKGRLCSEYNYELEINQYLCEQLIPSDISKRCALVNNKCIDQFIQCEDYNGNNKEICESIVPEDESYKCVFEGGTCIEKEKTSCSDYKAGSNEDFCIYIHLEDPKKTCVLFDNKCIETFKTCEYYEGDNIQKDICESIIPTREKDDIYWIDDSIKCVYDENKKCVTRQINCADMTDINAFKGEQICEYLNVNDENKECIFYNNKCIESYRYCENYNQNVEKNICEAIIPEDYHSIKCVYDSEKGECISERLSCSSFQLESFNFYCGLLGRDTNKKCEYSNGFCSNTGIIGIINPYEQGKSNNENTINNSTDKNSNDENTNNKGEDKNDNEDKIYHPTLWLIICYLLIL